MRLFFYTGLDRGGFGVYTVDIFTFFCLFALTVAVIWLYRIGKDRNLLTSKRLDNAGDARCEMRARIKRNENDVKKVLDGVGDGTLAERVTKLEEVLFQDEKNQKGVGCVFRRIDILEEYVANIPLEKKGEDTKNNDEK